MASGAAAIIGMGGIGAALADQLERSGQFSKVHRLSRATGFDPCDETSISESTAHIAAEGAPLTLVIVTTGMLHDDIQRPEKGIRQLDAASLARSFAINAIAPALVAKHLIPLMPRNQRAVFTALSARVGSISDNRVGGWHGYRASKAALNMLIKTISIEFANTHPLAVIAALHPGTVDTGMSKPFQGNIDPKSLFTSAQSATYLLDVIAALTPADSGKCFAWDKAEILP